MNEKKIKKLSNDINFKIVLEPDIKHYYDETNTSPDLCLEMAKELEKEIKLPDNF